MTISIKVSVSDRDNDGQPGMARLVSELLHYHLWLSVVITVAWTLFRARSHVELQILPMYRPNFDPDCHSSR